MPENIYISAARQISAQAPLADDWIERPRRYTASFVPAVEPDYRLHFQPNAARRMGKILKRALLVSRRVMEDAGVDAPQAIVTGTGFGCIENTEIFLEALVRGGEKFLKPTQFMQSTHNTISSLIAIDHRCHSYNMTYSHKALSFECALLDAFLRLRNGQITNALAGGHDELTPHFHTLLQRLDCLAAGTAFRSETAVAMMLTADRGADALCRLSAIETLYRPDTGRLRLALDRMLAQAGCRPDDIDAVLTGCNGMPADEQTYARLCDALCPGIGRLRYKHLFGDSFTSSATAVYVAATCLRRRLLPAHLFAAPPPADPPAPRRILLYHQSENKTHSLILLSSC
jgi:3-oxoacyl-(acyl-carrier-protein) synthase